MEIKIITPTYDEMVYYICPSCGRPILLNKRFYESPELTQLVCPFCKIEQSKNQFVQGALFDNNSPYSNVIKIQFGKSKSAHYKKAINLAKNLPNYCVQNNVTFCGTNDIIECCRLFDLFEELSFLAQKWDTANILYFDKKAKYAIDHQVFIARLKENANEYSILLNSNSQERVTYENLPYPYVYYPPTYGAFFSFSETINSDLYFCECEREAIENYLEIRKKAPLKGYTGKRSHPLDGALFPALVSQKSIEQVNFTIQYKANLCFKCNHVIPRGRYCHPMYGGEFEQKHGWYIQQEYLKNGIDPVRKSLGVILEDKCAPEIKQRSDLERKLLQSVKGTDEYNALIQEIEDMESLEYYINDKVRTDFGYRGIGEHWINETTLKHIVVSLFPNRTVLSHYRPEWLCGLELDIYVPEIKLAFEYQGIQHFKAVKHWGGKDKLKIQQEHDARKKRICNELGINLVYFDYTEEITTEYVKTKIASYL